MQGRVVERMDEAISWEAGRGMQWNKPIEESPLSRKQTDNQDAVKTIYLFIYVCLIHSFQFSSTNFSISTEYP